MDIGFKLQQSVEKSLGHYQSWIYDCLSPYLGERILDAGCAIGNITQHFLDKEFILGLDISKDAVSEISKRFEGKTNFQAHTQDLSRIKPVKFRKFHFDTITCLNVLEHIKDDKQLISTFNQILSNNGVLILLVPAFDWLFGEMDRIDNHHRRYTKKMLKKLFQNSGFTLKKQLYFNFFGMFGWFLNGKVLKKGQGSQKNFKIFNSLVPVFRKAESFFPPPIGLSILSIYIKTEEINQKT
ncbi:class I SAM-dependent methyltransferase [Patescibacteria group bacterium]